jgi:FAD/FMN-containing dehydrogenase
LSEAVYAHHMTNDETPDRILASYGPAKYEKLAALKAKYDPTNLFRPNSNIAPQGGR